MTEFIKLQTPEKTIQIGFTDQKVSGRAGLLTFAGFLHWHRFGALLALVLPHRRTSKQAIPVADLALGFLAGILAGAQKLAHLAHLRNDVMLPALLAIQRIGSQSTFTRFFQGFTSAGKNRHLRSLWRWCLERLPSRPGGYSLTWTRPGSCTRTATRRAWPPATPAWAPNCACIRWWRCSRRSSWWSAFGCDRQRQLRQQRGRLHPGIAGAAAQWIAIGLVRADSGFCLPEWLNLLEAGGSHIVVARLLKPVQRLLKKDLIWQASSVPGTEVAEVWHQEANWPKPRRLILLRHRVAEKRAARQRTGGKLLIDCPGYLYQALVTNLSQSVSPVEVWRRYNGRAGARK
ncbi:MAG: transposase [Verrucomicrobiales bacterium]|nr:transposase [Verrucomicrobiales bacterium]